MLSLLLPSLLIMFIPSTFKRPVSSWKALNLRKTLLMASSVRLKPLNCSRLPCVYAQETLTFLLTQKKTCVKNYDASALAGGAMSKLFGGGQKAASGGIQGDVLATDNNTVGMGDAGIKSAIQGSNVPNPDEAVPSFVSGA